MKHLLPTRLKLRLLPALSAAAGLLIALTAAPRTAQAAPNVAPRFALGNVSVVAWGANDFGQTNVPTGLSGVSAIAAGAGHTVALKADGSVVAWGWNSYGQTNVPTGLSGVSAIAAGGYHTVALKADGSVVACPLPHSKMLPRLGPDKSCFFLCRCALFHVVETPAG